MIQDLNNKENLDNNHISTQVCIIGAGTAGIFLAKLLSDKGVKVVILEAGSLKSKTTEAIQFSSIQQGDYYRGDEKGRSFGVGGTSTLWGGQMLPLTEGDISNRIDFGIKNWPIKYEELIPFYECINKLFNLNQEIIPNKKTNRKNFNKLFNFSGFDRYFSLRISSWIPFKKRNFYKSFLKIFKNDYSNVQVWINSTVIKIAQSNNSNNHKIEYLIARNDSGKTIKVIPEILIFAAGTLETTRILLEYDEATNFSITRGGAPLGNYLSDHLSFNCGEITYKNKWKFNHAIAPFFDRGIMRTPRLELTEFTQKKFKLTSGFVHFSFLTSSKSGFEIIRSYLRKKQGEQISSSNFSLLLIYFVILDVFHLLFWRIVFRRLWLPKNAKFYMSIDIEQPPNFNSSVFLSNDKDEFGRKKLIINWQITQSDIKVITRISKLLNICWKRSFLNEIAKFEPNKINKIKSFDSLYDVYHPTGTIRMGISSSDSIVDKNLRLWVAENGYVCSTGVFPSAGSANPGMTHLALTARLSEHILTKLKFN